MRPPNAVLSTPVLTGIKVAAPSSRPEHGEIRVGPDGGLWMWLASEQRLTSEGVIEGSSIDRFAVMGGQNG